MNRVTSVLCGELEPARRYPAGDFKTRTVMPTLLVTGGCGFIGSNFIRLLLSTDSTVSIVNFDALTYAGNLANLRDVEGNPRYKFVRGDVTDRESVRSAMQGVTDVIHFAA